MRAVYYVYLVVMLTAVYIADRGIFNGNDPLMQLAIIYIRMFCARSMFLCFISATFSCELSERFFAKLRDETIPVRRRVCMNDIIIIAIAIMFMRHAISIVWIDVILYYFWILQIGQSMVTIQYSNERISAAFSALVDDA